VFAGGRIPIIKDGQGRPYIDLMALSRHFGVVGKDILDLVDTGDEDDATGGELLSVFMVGLAAELAILADTATAETAEELAIVNRVHESWVRYLQDNS
jgi:hypothetical protein